MHFNKEYLGRFRALFTEDLHFDITKIGVQCNRLNQQKFD